MNKKVLLFIPMVVAVALVLGYFMGLSVSRKNQGTGSSPMLEQLKNNMGVSAVKYSTLFNLIENRYVDTVLVDSIAESMISDLLQKLDPHSSYIPAKDVVASNASLEGKFDGIGVIFNMVTDTIVIQNVVSGGPSSKVGIMSGDRIITIDDSLVAGRNIPNDKILTMLRGEGGSKVKLGIERQEIDSLIHIIVVRGKVAINSVVAAYMIEPGVGYIKLLRFSRKSHEEMMAAVDKLKKEGMKHLILDLTQNRGGYLDQAILISNEFLAKDQMIVSRQRRGVIIAEQRADGEGKLINDGLIVLVDEGSASSSEIVAGALQDNDRGVIIGRRTFGKGLVQEQISLFDGSLLQLTIARYHTPTGRCIQKPYENGVDEYNMDFYNRVVHGELVNRDSVKLDTTLKYTTPQGRIVYGGGGIMPDRFVPYDTLKYSDVERTMMISLLMAKYTNKFIDTNRSELLKVSSFESLQNFLKRNGNGLYNGYISYLSENGIKLSAADAARYRPRVENILRAYIGQFTKDGDNAFYRYLLTDDDIVLDALKYIKTKE